MSGRSLAETSTRVDFDNEIIPVITKAGCNTGACHGSAAGRGRLKLSLYGGDPAFDYRSIVLELEGRRINLTHPEESLVVLKPTEGTVHGGGTRLDLDGPGARLLVEWVAQGAVRSATKRLEDFHVAPVTHVVDGVGTTLQLQATARFSDGTAVDVTRWTVFTPEDPSAIEADPVTAKAKVMRRGRHVVVARYLDRVVPIEILVPLSDKAIDLSQEPRRNFVDDHVLQLLSTLRLPVSPPADDDAFLRRLTLDLTGRLPTAEQREAFLNDPASGKRDALIERLLNSDEFNDYWTYQFSKLFRIRSQGNDPRGALAYHAWLKKEISDKAPYHVIANQLLTSAGDTRLVGPANFYLNGGGPREQAEFASELFMGSRLRCANCHNHPLDRWTQDDYHGLAAIFAKVQPGVVVTTSRGGEVTHPRTGQAAVPRIPGEKFIEPAIDGRQALAGWLTDGRNPYFAKAAVNRLWKLMMGRGLVESTDDFRATNPATHPALLEELAQDFIANGYDIRHTLRLIAMSAAYARDSTSLPENRADDRFYSYAFTRPLEPEVLADAIFDVIGVADQYGDQPLGTRAITLFDPKIPSDALDILGRCSRTETCEGAAASNRGLSLKLHLFNGSLLNRKITDASGRLAELLNSGRTPAAIIDEFYRHALTRGPTSRERDFWNEQFVGAHNSEQQRQILEDFVWGLLCSREFISNH